MSKEIREAIEILKTYHYQLSQKVSKDVVEKKEEFDADGFGAGANLIENTTHDLNNIAVLIANLQTYASQPKKFVVDVVAGKRESVRRALQKWLDENKAPPLAIVPVPGEAEVQLLIVHAKGGEGDGTPG
jgi:vesicle coat complex subunit